MKFLSLTIVLLSFSQPVFAGENRVEVSIDVSGSSVPSSGSCADGEALKNALANYQSQCDSDKLELGCSSCDQPLNISQAVHESSNSSDGACKSTISISGVAHDCTAQ